MGLGINYVILANRLVSCPFSIIASKTFPNGCDVIWSIRQWRQFEKVKNSHIFENWRPIWGLDVDLSLTYILMEKRILYHNSVLARQRSQDICPPISQIVLKNFIKISLIIKECPEGILIKLAIVLKISKSSWNTDNITQTKSIT